MAHHGTQLRALRRVALHLALVVTCSALFALALHAEDEEVWGALERPDVAADSLAQRLARSIAALDDAGFGYEAENLTLYARGSDTERKQRAEHYAALYGKALEILERAGFGAEVPDDGVLLVYVKRPFLVPMVVAAQGKPHVLLIRQPAILSAPDAPAPVARSKQPPPVRKVLHASDKAVVYLADAAATHRFRAGPGSPAFALARAAVAGARLPSTAPPWLRQGLAAWLEEQLSDEARTRPLHLCGDLAPGSRDLLDHVLPAKAAPAPQAARLLGRFFAKAKASGTKLHTALVTAGTTSGGGRAALEAGFGKGARDMLVAVAKAGAEAEPACQGRGGTECPTCRGSGKAKVACWTCVGLKNVACPSCRGSPVCLSTACDEGWRLDSRVDKQCGLCYRGFYLCSGCKGKVRMPCKVCSRRGYQSVPCPTCHGTRRLPCPQQGGGPAVEQVTGGATVCSWCADSKLQGPCSHCLGSGHGCCKDCCGSQLLKCSSCDGLGCAVCKRRGFSFCRNCKAEAKRCTTCAGKGAGPLRPEACPLCQGLRRMPGSSLRRARLAQALRAPTAAEAKAHQEMLQRAVDFLLTCRNTRNGAFALRELRPSPGDAGDVRKPTLFSNAMALTALGSAGLGRDDARVSGAYRDLEEQADKAIATKGAKVNIQSVSFCLRALLAGGADPGGERVKGLIQLISKAQRSNGLWAARFGGKHEGDAYQGLYAVESLYLASRKGAKVPDSVWRRALTGATRAAAEVRKSRRKDAWISATNVTAGVALVLMTRAGIAREAPASLDEYRRLSVVQEGLAWLDRYFDIRQEAVIKNGCLATLGSDRGFSAYLYSIQRLAQLLKIAELGGERWHTTGARYLLTRQQSDGSFEEMGRGRLNGPLRCTATAILFLVRATPPLTEK